MDNRCRYNTLSYYWIEMLIAIALFYLLTWNAATASNLYHTDLSELELSTNDSYIHSQYKILQVPERCKISTCHKNKELAKAVHDYCFKDECDYSDFYCVQDSLHAGIVPFCAHLNKCNAHTRHIVKINDTFPDYVDLYEVPCPDGHVQPNVNPGCFSECVKDNSKLHFPDHPDVSDDSIINTSKPNLHIGNTPKLAHHNKTETTVTNNDIPDELHVIEENSDGPINEVINNDNPVTPIHGNSEGIGTINTYLLAAILILVSVVVAFMLYKLYVVCREQNGLGIRRGTYTRTNYSLKNKNYFNFDAATNININVDTEQQQAQDLLSTRDSRAECQDINTPTNENSEPRMEDLKGEELDQVTTEDERARGDGQSVYRSNTSVKQPYD